MLDVVAQMVRILKAGGKDTVVDMDNLLKREALDVIGECPPRCSMITPTVSTLTSYTVFQLLIFQFAEDEHFLTCLQLACLSLGCGSMLTSITR